MSMQTVSLSQLVPSKANPRKAFDAKSLEGLAASIFTKSLTATSRPLHSLSFRPSPPLQRRYAAAPQTCDESGAACELHRTSGEEPMIALPVGTKISSARERCASVMMSKTSLSSTLTD